MGKINIAKVWKIVPEETAWVRLFDIENPSDVERYKEMDKSDYICRWMVGEPMTDKEIKKFLSSHSENKTLFAAFAEEGDGKMEGWVQFLPEDKEKVLRIQKEILAGTPLKNKVWEISFARYQGDDPASKKKKGLISSAVRQACYFFKKPESEKETDIIAYTDPDNAPSERVLEKAGFVKMGKIKYDEDDEKEDNFWILDWDKLNDIYAKKDEYRTKK